MKANALMPQPFTGPPSRVQIENPQPLIDCGRHPAKACVGDRVAVSATIFRDGHDRLAAAVRYRGPGEREWREAPMHRSDAAVGDESAGGSQQSVASILRAFFRAEPAVAAPHDTHDDILTHRLLEA